MELLTAVNLVLPKLGERPVTSLAVRHPTLAILLPIIAQTQKTLLLRGWWFNEFDHKAFPGTDGEIAMGTDVLSFVPKLPNQAVLRALRLYNPETLSYVFTDPVEGRVRVTMDFDELPESAANNVFYAALVEAFTTDLGVTQELGVWQSLAASSYSDLLAEHLRQKKYNTRNSRPWRRFVRALQG